MQPNRTNNSGAGGGGGSRGVHIDRREWGDCSTEKWQTDKPKLAALSSSLSFRRGGKACYKMNLQKKETIIDFSRVNILGCPSFASICPPIMPWHDSYMHGGTTRLWGPGRVQCYSYGSGGGSGAWGGAQSQRTLRGRGAVEEHGGHVVVRPGVPEGLRQDAPRLVILPLLPAVLDLARPPRGGGGGAARGGPWPVGAAPTPPPRLLRRWEPFSVHPLGDSPVASQNPKRTVGDLWDKRLGGVRSLGTTRGPPSRPCGDSGFADIFSKISWVGDS